MLWFQASFRKLGSVTANECDVKTPDPNSVTDPNLRRFGEENIQPDTAVRGSARLCRRIRSLRCFVQTFSLRSKARSCAPLALVSARHQIRIDVAARVPRSPGQDRSGRILRSLVDPILGAVAVVILRVEVVLRGLVPAGMPAIRDRPMLRATLVGLGHLHLLSLLRS